MIRRFGKNWKLDSIAVFSLAIAMALSIIALSISNAAMLRPPFARNPDRLISIFTVVGRGTHPLSYPEYRYIRDHAHTFSGVAALSYGVSKDELSFGDREELAMTNTVSDNYFQLMGIQPFLGRFFSEGDDRNHVPAVVLTYSCWERWGSDPAIAGKTVLLNGQHKVTIVGVAPKQFIAPVFGLAADIIENISAKGFSMEDWDFWQFYLAGRLNPDATRAQARAEVQTLWSQVVQAYPESGKERRVDLNDFAILPPDEVRPARILVAVMIAAALLILLIACANAANLLLAFAVQRRQEALIKAALGASRARLIGEFLKESLVLCSASGLVGYALASAVLGYLSRFDVAAPVLGSFSIAADLHPGTLVIVLTLGLIVMASLVSGLAPALYASKSNLAGALSAEIAIGGTRRGLIRNTVVVVQVAVCTLVLVGSGLCLRSLHNLRQVDPGFSARNIVAVWMNFDSSGISKEQGFRLYDQLQHRAQQIYGVEAVTLCDGMPLGGESSDQMEIRFTDRPATVEKTLVDISVVGPNYFSTFGIPLLGGRPIQASDNVTNPDAIVINHFMAEKFWHGQDPIGRTIRIMDGTKPRIATIVGVARDGKYDNLDEPPRSYLYLSVGQYYQSGAMLVARTQGDPRLWADPLSRVVRQLGVRMPLPPVTMENWVNLTLFFPLLTLACVSALSLLGLILATAGLYGAISYSVAERRRELGIRSAIGALPAQLMQLVFRETLTITSIGVLAGLALGIGAGIIFRSQFYKLHPVEWFVLVPVTAAMIGASLAIAFLAARRCTQMNPMDAVRHT